MENTNLVNKESWNAYQEDYFQFHLQQRPDYFEFFAGGGVDLDDYLIPMLGDVKDLKLLDTCCACDAVQAFSWHNLGAHVTACDITPKAIEIASRNSVRMNFNVEFAIADMQKLKPIGDDQYDIVFATYPCWIQDLKEACRNWYRILKTGGRLLLNTEHPITQCIDEDKRGIHICRDYNKPGEVRYQSFDGTPLADRFGGWSIDLPSVCNMYRISDIINAISDAGFTIKKTHESHINAHTYEKQNPSQMEKLPCEFTVLATK